MEVAVGLVALVLTVIAVTAICERLELPAPIMLVAIGAVASYIPAVPEVRLTPAIVLVGLLPPLLYNAALQTSLVDFKANRRAILLLSVGLVLFTAAVVAVVVHAALPGVGWPLSFAIGAVVAPPDAVAATAIARRIGLPRRLVTVLEGESLLNDATALVSLKTALLAFVGTVTVTALGVAGDFVWTTVGGLAAGIVVFLVVGRARHLLISEPVFDTAVSMVTPFIAYVAAEAIHASGVLAVVVAGLLLGHKAPLIQTATSRISERLNWRTISFLLENAVFLLIGLQTHWIVDQVSTSTLTWQRITGVCVAAFVAVVVARIVWMFPARLLLLVHGMPRGELPPVSWTIVLSWAGMRGVVTLAAAFAIPVSAPHQEVLVLIALVVTAGTLGVQGLTLPWLVRRLGVTGPDPRQDALDRAELIHAASLAGLARLEEIETEDDQQDRDVRDLLRSRLEQRDFAAWERLGPNDAEGETPSERYARLRLDMLAAERARVLELRSDGRLPHQVVEDVLATLDMEESMIGYRVERRRELGAALDERGPIGGSTQTCEHLDRAPDLPQPQERVCEDCLRDGTSWVHLRHCMECGQVSCCDSSPRRHATAHFETTGHPVVRSAEPAELWRWCFVDELLG